jgi:two-component sensor histidine kinase
MKEGGVRILYVDDDPGIARLVERALGRRGFSVEHVGTSGEALARLEQGGIDAIGLDHFMPGGTGLDLLHALNGRPDAPPVVYVTSSGDTALAVAVLKAGAADYVPKDVAGEFLELLGTAIEGAIEQTRLKREKAAAEEAVREQRDRAEMLLREVNHRVGNSLALVGALVRLQASLLHDPAAVAALKEAQTRINAIARLHKQLYTSDDVRVVAIGSFVSSLAADLQTTMRAEGSPHNVRVNADDLVVATDKAVSIGVVVTELMTNAYKYAYPNGAAGEIRVVIRQEGDQARVVVEDDGVGWNGTGKSTGTGLGSQIVSAMATNLRADLSYDKLQRGTRIVLNFPV